MLRPLGELSHSRLHILCIWYHVRMQISNEDILSENYLGEEALYTNLEGCPLGMQSLAYETVEISIPKKTGETLKSAIQDEVFTKIALHWERVKMLLQQSNSTLPNTSFLLVATFPFTFELARQMPGIDNQQTFLLAISLGILAITLPSDLKKCPDTKLNNLMWQLKEDIEDLQSRTWRIEESSDKLTNGFERYQDNPTLVYNEKTKRLEANPPNISKIEYEALVNGYSHGISENTKVLEKLRNQRDKVQAEIIRRK